jgi:hypothetical protein
MGLIRGGLLVIVSVLLLVSLFAGFILLTMSWSLNYDNVKTELGSALKGNLTNKIGINELVTQNYPKMQEYCKNNSSYIVNYEGNIISVPCSVILEGHDAIVDNEINSSIEKIYFTNYNCNFWNCFDTQQIPFFLVSLKAQQYWYSKFNQVLILIGLLSICGFLLAEKKSNFFLLVSALIIIAVIPIAKIDWLISLTGKTAEGLLSVFFSKSYSVFIRGIALGVILLVIGVVLKFFGIGFKIQTILSKFRRSDKKEEPNEEKKIEVKEKKDTSIQQKQDSKKIVKKIVKVSKKK